MYLLLPHVYACKVSSGIVFLDTKRGRYFGIGSTESRALLHVVAGWSTLDPIDSSHDAASTNDAERIAGTLVAGGLLVHGGSNEEQALGKAAGAPAMPPVNTSLALEPWEARCAIRWFHVVRFLRAALSATAQLRWSTLDRIATRLRALKARESRILPETQTLRLLVSVYRRLRPFVFTSRNQCLFDSLVLIEFLRYHKIHPHWVFGVTTAPFAAHCWVQHGDIALNCSVESTREYAPIFAA